eukprot:1196020-Rhodomonas_salina.2
MGGKEATLLSIHPFLLEILEHLKGDGGGGDDGVPRVRGSGEGAKRAKLSVFSGRRFFLLFVVICLWALPSLFCTVSVALAIGRSLILMHIYTLSLSHTQQRLR